ncbi:FitA-like ribbon-helix-helix domain-containing protein [Streptomyces sp. NPDC050534]|uniref:FitA-like ribbon-helix-helix domain-containing protein n=1 Tax=Streptomyces sp. NPDC050534 TaxID=3365625 RepID=UPI00379AF9DA
MTVLTLRDVPEEQVHVLKARAAQAGTSLQAYLLELIARETQQADHGGHGRAVQHRGRAGRDRRGRRKGG